MGRTLDLALRQIYDDKTIVTHGLIPVSNACSSFQNNPPRGWQSRLRTNVENVPGRLPLPDPMSA